MPPTNTEEQLQDSVLEEITPDPTEPVVEEPVKEAPVEEAPVEEAKMLRVKLRSGKEYVGATERDILAQLVDDHEKLQTDADERAQQRTEVKGKIRYQEERKEVDGWNPQKYLDLLGTDPMEARRYQDRHYYGLSEEEDPVAAFSFAYKVADRVADSIETAEFLRNNPDASGLSAVDAGRLLTELDKEGDLLTAKNLEYAYRKLSREGAIAPAQSRQPISGNTKYEDIELKPKSRGETAPKVTTGATTQTKSSVTEAKMYEAAAKMTPAQFRAWVEEQGF